MGNDGDLGNYETKYREMPKHKFGKQVSAVDYIIRLCKDKPLSKFALPLHLGQTGFSFDEQPILMDSIDKEEAIRTRFFSKKSSIVVDFMLYVHLLREETVYFEISVLGGGVMENHVLTVTRLGSFHVRMPYPARYAAIWLLERFVIWIGRIKSFKVIFTLSSAGIASYQWWTQNSISQCTFVIAVMFGMLCAYFADWYSKD